MALTKTFKNRLLILAPAIPAGLWTKFVYTDELTLSGAILTILSAGIIAWIVIEVERFIKKCHLTPEF